MPGRARFSITGRTASATFFSTLAFSLSAPLPDGISAPVHRMAIVNLRIFDRISCRVWRRHYTAWFIGQFPKGKGERPESSHFHFLILSSSFLLSHLHGSTSASRQYRTGDPLARSYSS